MVSWGCPAPGGKDGALAPQIRAVMVRMLRTWFRRHRVGGNLIVDAYDTTQATDWTAIRDVMQVRREVGSGRRRLFMCIFAALLLPSLAVLTVLITLLLWLSR